MNSYGMITQKLKKIVVDTLIFSLSIILLLLTLKEFIPLTLK